MAKKTAAPNKLADTAEALGRMLGTVTAQVNDWRRQRNDLAKQLTRIIDSAEGMMRELGLRAEAGYKASRKTRKTTKRRAKTGGKRSAVSAAARRKMSLAAKKRWAARRAAKSKG